MENEKKKNTESWWYILCDEGIIAAPLLLILVIVGLTEKYLPSCYPIIRYILIDLPATILFKIPSQILNMN
jgi:hypothetical protein